ncbi:sensor histidine kinase [Cohnella laeviribosi]|uniref:sensor histidine kinase n=1 Tax=Cohnella laeviribosi TaxID=380174 RepID=UPI000368902D|nr:HAMP domain-containing sensor histidine kinase [Cohnella laeviribosi]
MSEESKRSFGRNRKPGNPKPAGGRLPADRFAALRVVLSILLVLIVLFLCWCVAFWAAEAVYRRFGWQPGLLARQLIVSVAGFLLFGTGMSIVSRLVQRKQMDYFQILIDAFRRISSGDFHIRLNPPGRIGHPFNQLVRSINEMAENLKNMEEMRQEFISNVSHEIQSPLTSIGGFAKVLKNDAISREQALHYLDIIERESERLSKLSDNMLRLASLDSDRHPFRPEAFRLDKQIRLLILACEPQWTEKELELNADLEPVVIEADQDLLSQVWVNLLHNAIKFTPAGGSIDVGIRREGDAVEVTVSDTGIGITEEDKLHMFERFYKADKSRTAAAGGSGLGLTIASKIVGMHRGSIEASGKPGEGTVMRVKLPLKQA